MNTDADKITSTETVVNDRQKIEGSLAELVPGVIAALETYSNVHRGTGHKSMVSTYLYEHAREIVLEYMGLGLSRYVVIFCTLRRAEKLKALLKPGSFRIISSHEIGLSLGIWALAVDKKALPKGNPFQVGGGTTRLISSKWIVWAKAPDKFEAGTPAIVNVIAFARALRMILDFGIDSFRYEITEQLNCNEILYHGILEQYSGRELLNEFRKTLIGGNVTVPTLDGPKPYINLDNGASTPTFLPVMETAIKTWRQPENVHKGIIHEVRKICSEILGASLENYDFIFTSNTTEAINLAAESLGGENNFGFEPVVLNTILEHNSNDLPWRMIPGLSLIRLNVDSRGFVDIYELENLLSDYNQKSIHGKKRIKLLAISGASNVLGVFNDLAKISRIAHRYGARLLVDAAQLVAHRKVDMESFGIDYLAFSGHKVYAPFGSGMLVVKKGLLNFSSSEMDLIKVSGEENPGGIAAMGKALLILNRIGFEVVREEEGSLTARALRGLSQIEGLKIHGIKDPDSPDFVKKGGVIVFELKGIFANVTAKKLSELGGIGVRNGCHCAHILVKHLLNVFPSLERFQHVLVTLLPGVSLPGIVRISLGIENSEEDIDCLIKEVKRIVSQSGSGARQNSSPQKEAPVVPPKELRKQIENFTKIKATRVFGRP
jgi:selenocysteine lyase/cysteine desulfurase